MALLLKTDNKALQNGKAMLGMSIGERDVDGLVAGDGDHGWQRGKAVPRGEVSGGGGKGCVHSHVWGNVGDGAAARGGSCV